MTRDAVHPRREPGRLGGDSTARRVFGLTGSSTRVATTPPGRWLQAPTTRPSTQIVGPALPLRSNSTSRCGPRYHPRCAPAHRRRVEARQQRHDRVDADRHGGRLDVVGEVTAGACGACRARRAVDRDLDRTDMRRGPPSDVRLGPLRPPRQVLASSPGRTCAATGGRPRRGRPPAGIIASSPVQSPIGVQRYWLDIHVPRGRVRTRSPSVDMRNSIRVDTPTVPSYCLPTATRPGGRGRERAWSSVLAGSGPFSARAASVSARAGRSRRRRRRRCRPRSASATSLRRSTGTSALVEDRSSPRRGRAGRRTSSAAWPGGAAASGARRGRPRGRRR